LAQEVAHVRARFDTNNPCPAWCTEPGGHEYRHQSGEPPSRALGREHTAELADLAPWQLVLRITQPEHAAGDGTVPTLARPCLSLYAIGDYDDETLRSESLRDLGRRLLAAADDLDALHIGPRRTMSAPSGKP
jgi:hypothetical protein